MFPYNPLDQGQDFNAPTPDVDDYRLENEARRATVEAAVAKHLAPKSVGFGLTGPAPSGGYAPSQPPFNPYARPMGFVANTGLGDELSALADAISGKPQKQPPMTAGLIGLGAVGGIGTGMTSASAGMLPW